MQRFLNPFISINCSDVSGGYYTHHQEHRTVHTASGIVQPIPLPAANVDEMELIHDTSRQQYWFDNT
jgi:hypothetical protein